MSKRVQPLPKPHRKVGAWYTARRYWFTNAWQHARRTTKKQRGDNPVALTAAVAAPLLTLVVLIVLDPASVDGYVRALLVAGGVGLVVFIGWFGVNLFAAPHRMWREGGLILEHLHATQATTYVVIASGLVDTWRHRRAFGQPVADLGLKLDRLEGDVADLLAKRPDDLRDFQRDVPMEAVSVDPADRLLARMEAKADRLSRIAARFEAELVPLPTGKRE